LLSNNDLTSTGVSGAFGVNDQTSPCVPVQLQNDSFSGIDTPVNPPSCAESVADSPSVPEPSSLLALMSALVGCFAIGARPRLRT
jgi:hypothetical protein